MREFKEGDVIYFRNMYEYDIISKIIDKQFKAKEQGFQDIKAQVLTSGVNCIRFDKIEWSEEKRDSNANIQLLQVRDENDPSITYKAEYLMALEEIYRDDTE